MLCVQAGGEAREEGGYRVLPPTQLSASLYSFMSSLRSSSTVDEKCNNITKRGSTATNAQS